MTTRRLAALDALRGAALVAMFAYHFVWDLAFFRLIDFEPSRSYGFRLASHAIASSFLFIAGASLTLAEGRAPRWRVFGLRLLRIAAAALAVTAVTAWFAPGMAVSFGILHCLALALLMAALLAPAPTPLVLAAAVAALAAPPLVAAPLFDAPAVQWLGLGLGEPRTLDWRPLLPWAGVTLLGLAAARGPGFVAALRAGESRAPESLAFLGRHSLAVYLVHQPILIGLVWLAALVLPQQSPEARDRREAQAYLSSCVAQCRAGGGEEATCRGVCVCVGAELKRSGLWRPMLDQALDAAGRARLADAAKACAAPR